MNINSRTIFGLILTVGSGFILINHREFEPEHLFAIPVITQFHRGWLSAEYLVLFAVFLGGFTGLLIRLIRSLFKPSAVREGSEEPQVRVINRREGNHARRRNALERHLGNNR